jgi:hypothetical protein
MSMAEGSGSGTSMATDYLETRLALVCGSFLAFAALTAFLGVRDQEAEAQTGSSPVAASDIVAVDDQGEANSAPAEQQMPTPVARSRGT